MQKRKKSERRRALRVRGLRQRWILNTVAPIFVLLLLIVTISSAGIASYYFQSMRIGLENKAQAAADSFTSYFMTSFSEYSQRAASYADSFEDKDYIELQFINGSGRVQVSSTSNLMAGTSPGTDDIAQALSTGKMRFFQGNDPQTGENILSVTCPLVFNNKVVGAMRYVTSLRQVNTQVMVSVMVILLVAVLCMALVLISNVLFINNVVEPVAVVSEAAKRISAGSYGIQIENHYPDELGELVDNINDMSLKIGRNEKMRSEFISSVSHELRTPLTAISGWGETILEDTGEDPGQIRRGIRIILRESRRLTGMVEELLEFSKMEDGRFTLQMEEVDVQAEFEDTIFTYRELFRQEGIELEYEPGDELIDPIPGDPERLKQVFCNVLDNAAKHGGAGKRIDAALTEEDGAQVIRIRDYGPGIPEGDLPYVKQKFYKGASKARGSGIGLAVCDEIIKLHDGSFAIENAYGGGCLVTIRLPEQGE